MGDSALRLSLGEGLLSFFFFFLSFFFSLKFPFNVQLSVLISNGSTLLTE